MKETTTEAALIKVAESLEKIADLVDKQNTPRYQQIDKAASDLGSLGKPRAYDSDALTSFLLS